MTSRMRGFTLGLIVVTVALLVAGGWFYRSQEHLLRRQVERELDAIAQLKTLDIVRWRAERLDEAAEVAARPLLRRQLTALLADHSRDPGDLLAEFAILQSFEHYRQILLVDSAGSVVLAAVGKPTRLDSLAAAATATALRSRRPVLSELHAEHADEAAHISAVAPILAAGRACGAIILVSEANAYLYPLIQRWPTPSRTAETLLIRRDGDDVLYLNDLRHHPGASLNLRLPLDHPDLPAALALRGAGGIVRGRDYRGVAVLASLHAVPDSPWYLVSKIDQEEALAVWRTRSALILGLVGGALALVAAAGVVVWQNGKRARLQALFAAERARRVSEERYATTLRSIGDGVIATDAQGRAALLNPVAEALTGWTSAQAQGRPLEEVFRIVNEETRQTVVSPVPRVLQEGVVVGLANHTVLISRDGVERPIADSGAPIRDDTGAVTGVVLVFRDQTEERAAQNALRESARLHQSTVSALSDGVLVIDADGQVQSCNPAAEAILGLTFAQMTDRAPGLSAWAPIRDDGSPFPLAELPVARTLATGISCRDTEVGNVRPDGSVVWLLVSSEPLFEEATGRVKSAVVSITDHTARRAGEVALKASEEQFRTVVETAPDGIFVQTGGCFRYLNAATLKIFGAAGPQELIGTPVLDRFHPDVRSGVAARIARLNDDHEAVPRLDVAALRLDGSLVDLEVGAVPFTYESQHGALVFARDVSERKQAEAERVRLQSDLLQAQKMESVGRLAGGVAHDFNNMLGVIIGHADLALMQTPDHDVNREHLQAIETAAQRSADLTRQLLAFARKQTVAPKVLDLNAAVPDTLKLLGRLVGEDIDLAWRPGKELWPVLVDPGQIDQILTNLAANARDAIRGTGTITIETGNITFDAAYCERHPEFQPGRFVMLAVSDDGEGMDRATLDHMFEPFFTTKSLGHGTGLGLATVYGIVKQNGGFINVYSEPDRGTTFKIYLTCADGLAVNIPARTPAVAPTALGEVVLLVEDEPALLAMSRELLEGLGYTVLTAASPAEAITFVTGYRGEIDLLVTDVVMPGLNGRVLAERLRAIMPDLKCLFMSGYTPNAIAHRGVLDEGVHFLQKPFSRHDLATRVRLALEGN